MDLNGSRHMPTEGNEKIAAALEKSGLREVPAAMLTLSDEAKMLFGQAGTDKLQNDTEKFFQTDMAARLAYGGSDEFAVYGNDQWLVFSKFLYDTGFYDDMSNEDMKDTEQILMKITDEMDNVFMSGHNPGIDLNQFHSRQLDSHEARLELESSAAALQYFSENLLDKANKADFDKLIDKYYAHNTKVLNNDYASIKEKFLLGRSKLPGATKERFDVITHGPEEINNFTTEISDLFKLIDKENLTGILQQVRERFLTFMMGKGDDNMLREIITDHSEEMFGGIDDYWSGLVETVDKKIK